MFSLKKSEEILYNKIIFLSRNKLLYEEFGLKDTFQNRINLIFIHISFIFIKIKNANSDSNFKNFYQKMFNFIFKKVELNMRELGFGDTNVNKKMKFLVKSFYNILFFCEKFNEKRKEYKRTFFKDYLKCNINKKTANYDNLIVYFQDFQTFCFDLSSDSVLKGEFKFKFN